ncbi:DUF177 domain-containing protein [Aristophania vespae]|uniref:DUF177 domain-containing protein n=1 Tax=Aristophania vespae TaxID=2697033 RepID=A0A6P1NDZ3_9PROT|nr:DUF177 domain-containing protein [Aristophania vespae]QHI95719.1 DUF177 domain-containing protein [Aristophania vespae]UMM63412.1 hypothetical protein DM15PD_03750 [Aristophania vespae]
MSSQKSSQSQGDIKKISTVEVEFSRKRLLSQIGRALEETIIATPDERKALAQRFYLPEIKMLKCVFELTALAENRVVATGILHAKVVQSCIITGEDVEEDIEDHFQLRFIPRRDMVPDESLDIEALLAQEYDEVPYNGRVIDLGEAAAEQLALCLNPYPRKKGEGLDQFVDVTPTEPEPVEKKQENPFAVLSQLKDIDKK